MITSPQLEHLMYYRNFIVSATLYRRHFSTKFSISAHLSFVQQANKRQLSTSDPSKTRCGCYKPITAEDKNKLRLDTVHYVFYPNCQNLTPNISQQYTDETEWHLMQAGQ
ncbi:hypothetical protein AVEN_29438-1 [Araneus ventricosus]|uniref:Uncharacterized protein n=1 Tax=Araneus ventricosus TaxID=182803 RepID=A0A4Y2CZR1_ARAVE|nr:hypothetical protein AVEN_29438-1 [Araneus ventricosus]